MLDPSSPRVHRTAGIDLGTTNSVIAQLDPAGRALLTGRDEQGRSTVPSVVGWDQARQQLVAGREALAALAKPGPGRPPPLPLSSIKRFMGLERRFPLGPQSLTPVEVSAVLLRQLRDRLAATLADPRQVIDRAIITMPAYFNHNQIEATRQAGELAGYEVAELLHEPTAAAIYYSWVENHGDATYLVYDLGGGTFDVSVIRRRLGDYEVLAVSGDAFLGGDDFDRLLATHLLEAGTWRWGSERISPAALFDPTTPEGSVPFARLVRISEAIKVELTTSERVDHYVPCVVHDRGRDLALEASVTRDTFNLLIKDKIDRTIDCCHEALALARHQAEVRLADVDHVILVGGSSRLPLVRERVQAAFCSPGRPEHVRCPAPLLHEPDLCVAYGAALRAAGHGTHYRFQMAGNAAGEAGAELDLHITSPASTREAVYQASGVVRLVPTPGAKAPSAICDLEDGASVRIRSLETGLVDEAFLDRQGAFAHDVELLPEADNAMEWTVCDADGRERARIVTSVRLEPHGRPMGQGVLPTPLIVKPLSIEVLGRGRRRVKQVVAPVGATLPGTFRCVCRTSDQSGRVVVPVWEENRVVKQLLIDDLDRDLPVGSPVEVDLAIDGTHAIEVSVRVRGGDGRSDRCETAVLSPPPPPSRPSRADLEEVEHDLERVLEQLAGRHRARVKARAGQLRQDLLEALSYDDEAKAIQRLAELRDLLAQAERARDLALDPPWPRFAALVRDCLDLAAEVARQTGRPSEDLFAHVHAQDRYAEQAHEEHNQALYRECWDNLEKYAGYLTRLLRDSRLPVGPEPARSPEEEARAAVEHFRALLSGVWKQARSCGRTDLEGRLADVARQASGLGQRLKADPHAALREARWLGVEVEKVQAQLEQAPQGPQDDAGLLEGSS
jgi:molecular chaperone DnaK